MFDFPTIFEWIERLEPLRGLPAAYLALLAAFIIVVIWDWRVTVLALAVQYLAVGILFIDVLDPRLTMVKVLVGWFICLMLYLTGRQVNWGRPGEQAAGETITEETISRSGREMRIGRYRVSGNAPFRLLLALVVVLVVLALGQRAVYQLPAVSAPMNVAIYALGGMGLLALGLTTEPLKAGAGILLFMAGFELFYNTLEQSVAMLAFLAAGKLVLTLAIAYLAQARRAQPLLLEREL